MSYARLQTEILAAREIREQTLLRVLDSSPTGVVFAATSIPGEDKNPAGTDVLFRWFIWMIRITFGTAEWHTPVFYDALGPYTIFSTPLSPVATKLACVEIEDMHDVARLLDLDVYRTGGDRIGRVDLGLETRRCLLCDDAAVDCIRTGRHDPEELNKHVSLLLDSFSHAPLRTGTG